MCQPSHGVLRTDSFLALRSQELLFSYNISTTKGDNQRQGIENIAHRVGLKIPTNYHVSFPPPSARVGFNVRGRH
jgi:hypothetical protein